MGQFDVENMQLYSYSIKLSKETCERNRFGFDVEGKKLQREVDQEKR
jgi:hypothetical protein